jgi:hypothetical protein
MYCPNCGKPNSTEQKFCRSCGLSLEKVVQTLVEQLPATNLDKHLQDQQRKVERWLHIIAGGTISIIVGAVLWGLIYEIILVKGDVLVGSLFLTCIIGFILSAGLAIYRESLLKANGKRQLPQAPLAQSQDTANLLAASSGQSISSITEHTTELLGVEKPDAAK